MSFSGGLYLTNSGRLALSKVQADSTKTLHFTKFAFGDGALNGGLEIERTSLVNRKDTSNITRLRVNGDNTCTVGTKRLGNAVGGYYLREIGLYAKDPDNGNNEILYGYANAGDDAQYIPAAGGAEIVEKTINIIISINNGTSVTATLSTGVYVTPEEFEAHVNNKSNPHDVTAAQIDAAEADHTHGAITNDGKIGTDANKAVFTGVDGALKAGTLPIAAGGTGAVTADTARENLNAQKKRLTFTNTAVATSAWVADETYTDYPYRATIPLTGVTATSFAEVVLSSADAVSGVYAPVCETYAGGVYLYANAVPSAAMTIPTIVIWG